MNLAYRTALKINFVLTTVGAVCFLELLTAPSLASVAVVLVGIVSTSALIYGAIWLLLLPLAWTKRLVFFVAAPIFVFFELGVFSDYFIFRLFKYHVNGMILNTLTSPAAADSVHIGFWPQVAIALVVLSLFLLQPMIVRWALRQPKTWLLNRNRTFNRRVLPILAIAIALDKGHYALSDLRQQTSVIRNLRVVPLYQPLTLKRFAKRLGYTTATSVRPPDASDHAGDLRYPFEPIRIDTTVQPPNILLIIVDAMRNDMLDPSIAPNATRLAADSTVFKRHLSGGITTRHGVFSIFYGLSAGYWDAFLAHEKPPVLMDVLKRRGYYQRYISSTNLAWPEFRRTVFVSVQNKVQDAFPGVSYVKDASTTTELVRTLPAAAGQQPFFLMLFLDSAHGPYSYPRTHARYLPDKDGTLNYIELAAKGSTVEVFNQYRNAIGYVDERIGEVVAALKANGLYDTTWIVLTGDHGEEFSESGNFGHNSAFSYQQAHPVLFIKRPGHRPETVERLTSHLDLAPTLLSAMGVVNPPQDFSNGQDLFSQSYSRKSALVYSWTQYALMTAEHTIVFNSGAGAILWPEVFDAATYRELPGESINQHLPDIADALRDNTRFFK